MCICQEDCILFEALFLLRVSLSDSEAAGLFLPKTVALSVSEIFLRQATIDILASWLFHERAGGAGFLSQLQLSAEEFQKFPGRNRGSLDLLAGCGMEPLALPLIPLILHYARALTYAVSLYVSARLVPSLYTWLAESK